MTNLVYLIEGLKAGMYDVPQSTAKVMQEAIDALSALPAEPKQAVAVNVNDPVFVQLTDFGRMRLKIDDNELWATSGLKLPPLYVPPQEDADGWSKWQLWALMRDLGKYCVMGCEMPFKTEMRLAAPPAAEPKQREIREPRDSDYADFDGLSGEPEMTTGQSPLAAPPAAEPKQDDDMQILGPVDELLAALDAPPAAEQQQKQTGGLERETKNIND